MIRLSRNSSPLELDDEKCTDLTTRFALSGEAVWNASFVRKAVLALSHGKCAYCETRLDEESKYLEIDHFRCKSFFPDLVVEWNNLVPSCKRCNTQKGSHNIEADGLIIDPFHVDPKNHLFLKNYRLVPRDDLGRLTIETLYLNDSARVTSVRFDIGEQVALSLERIREDLEQLKAKSSRRLLNRVVRGIETLLTEAGPSAEFAATAATVLLGSDDYEFIRSELQAFDLWGPLQPLENEARRCALL